MCPKSMLDARDDPRKERRCWGFCKGLRRCQREGPWRLFCHDHDRQWLGCFVAVFTVGGAIASFRSCSKDTSSVQVTNSKLNRSPIVVNSPNAQIDNSVSINKSLPEIVIGTITDMSISGASPYEYSFVLRYSTTMDSPARYQVEYIDLELHEVIRSDDGMDESVFLKSIRLEESFKSFGMLRNAAPLRVSFRNDRRIRDMMIKLVMGVEGGLIKEDTRTMWRFGGE